MSCVLGAKSAVYGWLDGSCVQTKADGGATRCRGRWSTFSCRRRPTPPLVDMRSTSSTTTRSVSKSFVETLATFCTPQILSIPVHFIATLYHTLVSLLFLFSAENSCRLFFSGRRSLTTNCALSTRPSLNAVMSPSTGCYKPILLTLYGGLAAAMR